MYPLNTVLVGYAFDLVKDIFITPRFDDDESDFDDFDPTEPGVEPGYKPPPSYQLCKIICYIIYTTKSDNKLIKTSRCGNAYQPGHWHQKRPYFEGIMYMASVAITTCGAVLNAVAFIGSNYLACFLSGDGSRPPSKKKRHKGLEVCQAAYAKYEKEPTKLLD